MIPLSTATEPSELKANEIAGLSGPVPSSFCARRQCEFDPSYSFTGISFLIHRLAQPTASLYISSPPSLRGTLEWAMTSFSGPTFAASSLTDFNVTTHIILMHSQDMWEGDEISCRPLSQSMNEEGDPYRGSILLIPYSASCGTHEQISRASAAGAIGLALFREDVYMQNPALWRCQDIPLLTLSAQDGRLLFDYLMNRRRLISANKTAGSSAALNSSDVLPIVATAIGTGPIIPSEREALRQIALAMKISPDNSTIYPECCSCGLSRALCDCAVWTSLERWTRLEDPSFDPCLNRIAGLWCEKGHVTTIHMLFLGLIGSLHQAFAQLTQLRYLNLGGGKAYSQTS